MINYYQKRPKKQYALYKGDKFITVGTKKEVAEYWGVKPTTISYYTTPAYKKRRYENGLLAIKVEND